MATSNKRIAIIVIMLFIVVVAITSNVKSPFGATASVTNGADCSLYVGLDGKTYQSFSELKNTISDTETVTNEALQSYGLIEKSDGVYLCQ